jgi:cytochrome c oxidase assembly factor CtaG
MKNLALIVLLTFSFPGWANNETNPQPSEDALMQAREAEVAALVAESKAIRQQLTGRSVAGMSSEDAKWAQEYERMMADDSGTDYLELALKEN